MWVSGYLVFMRKIQYELKLIFCVFYFRSFAICNKKRRRRFGVKHEININTYATTLYTTAHITLTTPIPSCFNFPFSEVNFLQITAPFEFNPYINWKSLPKKKTFRNLKCKDKKFYYLYHFMDYAQSISFINYILSNWYF